MDFLLQIEIIIWLVLSLMLVITPLIWLARYYLPHIEKLVATLKEIEFPDTSKLIDAGKKIQAAASLAPTPEATDTDIPEKTEISTEKKDEPIHNSHEDINQEKEIEETVVEKETTKSVEKTVNHDDRIKKNKKLETIKFTAMASKERGKMDQYEKKLVEGLALDPQNIEFLSLLSTHYFESKQEVKALTLLKKVVNKEPKNHKAIRQIGQIYAHQEQFDTAQLLIEKAIALKNDHPKYYISLVEIWYETGKIQKAIQTMEKILKLRPTNTDYLLTMATLYEEDKKPTLASKYFSKVLEVDPSNTHAKKGMKRVK